MSSLLDEHAAAFSHFGGRTETILYDNPRTIVENKDEESGHIVWNRTFKDRMDFYGVEIQAVPLLSSADQGQSRERRQIWKRNALVGRRFRDLDHLNEWLVQWCLEVADERVHGTTHEQPAERFRRAEAGALIPVDVRPVPSKSASSIRASHATHI
ncbi:MAG: transposase [Blastocatellales bacterium]|nr:transposase [Blastocatellales bacterium]